MTRMKGKKGRHKQDEKLIECRETFSPILFIAATHLKLFHGNVMSILEDVFRGLLIDLFVLRKLSFSCKIQNFCGLAVHFPTYRYRWFWVSLVAMTFGLFPTHILSQTKVTTARYKSTKSTSFLEMAKTEPSYLSRGFVRSVSSKFFFSAIPNHLKVSRSSIEAERFEPVQHRSRLSRGFPPIT